MSDTITITGNIATAPEERRLPNGAPVVSFRLASTQRRYDKEAGRWVDQSTNWYTVSAFRQLAQHVMQSLHKGERVIVTGKLKLREWENSTTKGMTAEVDAEGVGHDLLWGTTRFSKDDGGQSLAAPETSWAVPGSDAPSSEYPAGELTSGAHPEPALVGAGSSGGPYTPDAVDGPF